VLLNKIPCLDKGYVALIDSCNTTQKLRDIGEEFFFGTYPTSLEEFGSMTVVMKCPLFIQLNLSKYNFRVINALSTAESDIEVYRPNAGEIMSKERSTSETIAADISRTADALIINPTAYMADGCDRFISQLLTPINTYTTLIVQGSYSEWCKFAYQRPSPLPKPIEAYTIVLQQIITAEWK
jgi:hypothetical protein